MIDITRVISLDKMCDMRSPLTNLNGHPLSNHHIYYLSNILLQQYVRWLDRGCTFGLANRHLHHRTLSGKSKYFPMDWQTFFSPMDRNRSWLDLFALSTWWTNESHCASICFLVLNLGRLIWSHFGFCSWCRQWQRHISFPHACVNTLLTPLRLLELQ